MKYKKLGSTKLVVLFGILILAISIVLDIDFVMGIKKERKYLANYIAFESININERKKVLFDRIKTSIAFKPEKSRSEYDKFNKIEHQDINEIEKNILTLYHPNHTTMNRLPNNDDIADARKLLVNTGNKDIKIMYESLFIISMLELLASDVEVESGGWLSKWELIRPITEDSVYIGTHDVGGYKTAFRINGRYFEEEGTDTYTVPMNDTIRIETFEMINKGRYIDTAINVQILVDVKGTWKNRGI